MRVLLAAVDAQKGDLDRELREELARDDLEVGLWIGRRHHTFWLGRWMTQRERWVRCRADPFEVAAGDPPDGDEDLGV